MALRHHGRPKDSHKYIQIDHILCPKRWKNAIVHVESRPDIAIDTDHAVLTADIRIKLGQSNQQKRKKNSTDTETQA
jgi:endonuclease/exonuclease/phosphatase family metal-dependent hydrolase